MTRRDKWAKRPCVERYFAFRDECRLRRVSVTNGDWITFVMPMPDSWSEKKKALHEGQPHTQRPDFDNLAKALSDAIHDEDAFLHDIRITKIWGRRGEIRVQPMVGPSGVTGGVA